MKKFVKVRDKNPRILEKYRSHKCWYWLVEKEQDFDLWGDWPFLMAKKSYLYFFEKYGKLLIRENGSWMTPNGFEVYEEKMAKDF